MSMGISIPNAKRAVISGNSVIESCLKCGHRFDSFKNINGVYQIKDGEATMLETLGGLNLAERSIEAIKKTDFNSVSSEEELLVISEMIDKNLYQVILDWITQGIALITIVFVLSIFSKEINSSISNETKAISYSTEQIDKVPAKRPSRIEIQAQSARLMPDSVKQSFIDSFKSVKDGNTLKKVRDTRSLDVDKLRAKAAEASKSKNKEK